ncbi:hypothetical protein ACVGWG_00355, partial [Enterobacter asburiae]
VMMTAVSFIIGVLALMLAPRPGAHTRPINGTPGLTGKLVGTRVGIRFIPAQFVLLQRLRDWGDRLKAVYYKQLTHPTKTRKCTKRWSP